MLNGGLVTLDNTTAMKVTGVYGTGVLVDGTQVPDGTVGSGLVIHLDGDPGTGSGNEIGVSSTYHDAGFVPLRSSEAGTASSVTMDHLTVTGAGARIGLQADSGSSITATNSTVTIIGQNGSALDVEGGSDPYFPFPQGGTINFIDSTAIADGAARSVARAILGTPAVPNTLNITNSTLKATGSPLQAAGITALSALLNVNIYASSQITENNGMLVSAVDASALLGLDGPTPSIVNLVSNTNSVLAGDAMADATSTLNMTLNTSTHWTGASLDATNVTLDSSPGLWTMNANSNVTQTVTNAGKIEYTVPTVVSPTQLTDYKTLTTHDYISNGGTISLNTYLGDDSAPSDRLVIRGGTATGTTTLHIANTIGPGAPTTAKGILVVEVKNDGTADGTTALGAFVLDGGSVSSGGYTYTLYRNADQQWYLINNQKKDDDNDGDDDGGGGGDNDGGPATSVPTLSRGGELLLLLLLAGVATTALRRRVD
jgi:hypothetical protein